MSTEIAFATWGHEAESNLKSRFAIDFEDVGLSLDELRNFAEAFRDPRDFVDWFAEKYDLTSRQEFDGWHRQAYLHSR